MKTRILFNSNSENSKNPSIYKASLFDWNSESDFLIIFYTFCFLFNSNLENLKKPGFCETSLFNSDSENFKKISIYKPSLFDWL